MNNKLTTKDILEQSIYPNIDIMLAFAELSPRPSTNGRTFSCECPSCGKKRAFITVNKKSGSPQIACNRRDSCGYYEGIWGYVQSKGNLTKQETLKELANLASYDLEEQKELEEQETTNKVTLQEALRASQQTKYVEFEEKRDYVTVAVSKWISKYSEMNIKQKVKMIYTFIYQYSLQTNQDKKNKFYKSRGIDLTNLYVKDIGFLSPFDVKKLTKQLIETFPIDDLIQFGVIKKKIKNDEEIMDKNGNPIYVFKQYCFKGFCVVPNYDLYSNMVTGLKFRNIELASWQPKSMKEPEMSRRDLVYPLPFAFSREMLINKNSCIFLVEGHIDGLSLPVTSSYCGQSEIDFEKSNTYFIASPGVNGISEEFLGLLRGKFICLCFDQDEAGRKGSYGAINISYGEEKASFVNDFNGKQNAQQLINQLESNGIPFNKVVLKGMKDKLEAAGARVFIKHWDINLGGDVNELRLNGNLNKVFNFN